MDMLTQILVARRRPDTGLTVSMFMVDQQCLGLKNANFYPHQSREDYTLLHASVASSTPLIRCTPELAARIIAAARQYAEDLGFSPHADFHRASTILDGVDATTATETVPLGGRDGKPLYVAGPYDNAPAIIQKLTARLGEDGFHFIAPLPH